MNKNTINLENVLKIIKKKIKVIYFFITIGLLVGLFGIFVNINYIEKKFFLSSKISIKNPLENYLVLDLFNLDKVQINEKGISFKSTEDKIKNYHSVTREYFGVLLNSMNLKNYEIYDKKYNYKINTIKNDNELNFTIKNISNPEIVEQCLNKMVNDFNRLIRPIILRNILFENSTLENYLEISKDQDLSEKLSMLIEIRKEAFNSLKDNDFEIFNLSFTKQIYEIPNSRIIIVSLLISFSLFLMFIILRK